MPDEPKFTVAEIRRFIEQQDSLGDVLYNCTAEKIIKAQEPQNIEEEDAVKGLLYPGHEMWDD